VWSVPNDPQQHVTLVGLQSAATNKSIVVYSYAAFRRRARSPICPETGHRTGPTHEGAEKRGCRRTHSLASAEVSATGPNRGFFAYGRGRPRCGRVSDPSYIAGLFPDSGRAHRGGARGISDCYCTFFFFACFLACFFAFVCAEVLAAVGAGAVLIAAGAAGRVGGSRMGSTSASKAEGARVKTRRIKNDLMDAI
jgi:hypothetical protein